MLIINLFAKLPLRGLYVISDIICFFLNRVIGYRRKVILQNLANAFPEKSEKEILKISDDFYSNLSDLFIESIKAFSISKKEIQKRVSFTNISALSHLMQQNKSIIILTSHNANWEWGFLGFSASMDYPIDAVYKKLSNDFFNKMMLTLRSKFGANMIEKDEALKVIAQHRNQPSLIGLASDQAPHSIKNRVWLKFLNQDTVFYNGMERIAFMMGYPVYYVGLRRIKRGYYEATYTKITDDPKLCMPNEILQKYSECIEKDVRNSPSDYLWSHKRWKHKRPELVPA